MGLDRMGRSGLHYAAGEGDLGKIRALIADGEDVNLRDKDNWTPLHFAADSGRLAAAELLLDNGAEIDVQNSYGNSPLWVAMFSRTDDSVVLVRTLLARGANPDGRNNNGKSPKDMAEIMVNEDYKEIFGVQ